MGYDSGRGNFILPEAQTLSTQLLRIVAAKDNIPPTQQAAGSLLCVAALQGGVQNLASPPAFMRFCF
jgi:hypothetical protein